MTGMMPTAEVPDDYTGQLLISKLAHAPWTLTIEHADELVQIAGDWVREAARAPADDCATEWATSLFWVKDGHGQQVVYRITGYVKETDRYCAVRVPD